MNNKWLGVELAFPMRPDGKGGLALVEGEAAVEDCLRAIIETQRGSHVMEPWLGWPIQVFAVVSDLYAISEVIKAALIDGEPRIDPERLSVEVYIEDNGIMPVVVTYSIKGVADTRTFTHGYRSLSQS
jgi:phage baseplate assembly protein W